MTTVRQFSIKQAGISLLEVSLSFGIIAVILVLATMLYYTTSNNQQINILTTNMGALSDAETRWALNHNGTYATTATAVNDLVKNGYLSPSLAGCTVSGSGASVTYTGCAVPNPWGGTIAIAAGATANTVTFTGKANNLTTCNQVNDQNRGDIICSTTTLAIVKTLGA